MQRSVTVNMGNLVLSLSDSMDLASPSLIQHQQRTAFAVLEMGKIAKFPHERLETIFISALLHDIGAFSLEEKKSIQDFETQHTEEHCVRGERLLSKINWLQEPAKIVRAHHTEWRHWGESIENPLVFNSQILSLADYVERLINRDQFILHQHEDIISKINAKSGSLFHPEVIGLFTAACGREEFWLDIISPKLYYTLLNEGPFRRVEITFSGLSLMAELFRNIIDFRSRFTSTHSSGVAAAASMISKIFGMTASEIALMEIAGNLHDIGKLAVPNSILEKPEKLSKEEMGTMKAHTYYTYAVINTIGGLQQIAEWAAYHHEKLDGSGYPFRCTEDVLSSGARIMMVADIFTALSEDRPYRKGMHKEKCIQIIRDLSERKLLDTKICNILFENYDEIALVVSEKQSYVREFYEKQFAQI